MFRKINLYLFIIQFILLQFSIGLNLEIDEGKLLKSLIKTRIATNMIVLLNAKS